MSQLLLIKNIKVIGANALSSLITCGFPSITAFGGFITNLNIKLKNIDESIKLKGVGVYVNKFDLLAEKNYEYEPYLKKKDLEYKNKKVENKSFQPEAWCDFTVSLITYVLDGNVEEQEIAKTLTTMKLAGGDIIINDVNNFVKNIKYIPLDNDNVLQEVRKLLKGGVFLISRNDLVKNGFEDIIDAISVVDNSRKYNGWIVPITVGYKKIATSPKPSVRNPKFKQIIGTPLFTLGEFIRHFENINEVIWDYRNDDEYYYLDTIQKREVLING